MPHEDLLNNLTEPQHAAVTHVDGPLLVLAGAGSGKTRVITRRAAYIARTAARPDQVLAITFTNKAAGEMRERMTELGIGRSMWVCTFHSLCVRLLRLYGDAVGIKPGFSIFDDADSRALVREAVSNCGLHVENWQPRAVLAAISNAKMQLMTPEGYEAAAGDFTTKSHARVYAEYQRMLHERNACDFDDLLMHVARMLSKRDDIRNELSDRFRYLLIDEYQDTNHAQYLIASQLAQGHRNICATGDPDQSIYAWRGADINNILDFEADYEDATVIRLEQNFRSTGAILSAASTLISTNQQRKHKDLWTDGEWGANVRVWTCEDGQREAEQVVRDIAQYCADGGKPGDVATFYRVNALSRVLEDAFRSISVPYQIARGVEFYSRKEIKDVLAYMRIIVNPADETAMLRAINTPARGIGKVTIDRLRDHARSQNITLDEAIARVNEITSLKSARKKVAVFAQLLEKLREAPRFPVHTLVDAVIKETGLEESLRNAGDIDNDPLDNVRELVTAAQQYDQSNAEGSLDDWLHQVSLVSDLDAIKMNGGAVTLMTLHAAKGLEFPVVYIIGLEETLLPHRRTLDEDPNATEEERRLAFVGMTRARQRLTLSHAVHRMVRGVTERRLASRFLQELPNEEVQHQVFEQQRDRSRAHLGRFNDDVVDDMDDGLYYPGRRVRHEEYGEGMVVRIESRLKTRYIRILFKDLVERAFALDHVSLYIIEE